MEQYRRADSSPPREDGGVRVVLLSLVRGIGALLFALAIGVLLSIGISAGALGDLVMLVIFIAIFRCFSPCHRRPGATS